MNLCPHQLTPCARSLLPMWTGGTVELVSPSGYTQNNVDCWTPNASIVANGKVQGLALYERDY